MFESITEYTETQIDDLQDEREINYLVARDVMGWKDLRWQNASGGSGFSQPAGWYGRKPDGGYCNAVDFAGDIRATWLMEEKIVATKQEQNYGYALWEVVVKKHADWPHISDMSRTFLLAHATPLQRCKAALKLMLWLKKETAR